MGGLRICDGEMAGPGEGGGREGRGEESNWLRLTIFVSDHSFAVVAVECSELQERSSG